jgi:hypothetical protein
VVSNFNKVISASRNNPLTSPQHSLATLPHL